MIGGEQGYLIVVRKTIFWLHLGGGVLAGIFIFVMAATGVVLAFEPQILEFVDRDVQSVATTQDAQQIPTNTLLHAVRRAGEGEPTAISIRHQAQATVQFSIGRGKAVYVDPYSSAVLGSSSQKAQEFFQAVERLHRTVGAPLGLRSAGRWMVDGANLLFSVLLVLGVALWFPRQWTKRSILAATALRSGLCGRARDWNWHNVLGIWFALPLLVISLSGVVMSYQWANALLFRLSGSPPPTGGRGGPDRRPPPRERSSILDEEPDYDRLLAKLRTFDGRWQTITVNVARSRRMPISALIETGTGGQPQRRTTYLLDSDTGTMIHSTSFASSSLGERLRAFVRFGHSGEYYGLAGQALAALASLAAGVLVYTGLSLATRRLIASNSTRSKPARLPKLVIGR